MEKKREAIFEGHVIVVPFPPLIDIPAAGSCIAGIDAAAGITLVVIPDGKHAGGVAFGASICLPLLLLMRIGFPVLCMRQGKA